MCWGHSLAQFIYNLIYFIILSYKIHHYYMKFRHQAYIHIKCLLLEASCSRTIPPNCLLFLTLLATQISFHCFNNVCNVFFRYFLCELLKAKAILLYFSTSSVAYLIVMADSSISVSQWIMPTGTDSEVLFYVVWAWLSILCWPRGTS